MTIIVGTIKYDESRENNNLYVFDGEGYVLGGDIQIRNGKYCAKPYGQKLFEVNLRDLLTLIEHINGE